MPLTEDQIKLANQRGSAKELPDGRIDDGSPAPSNKPSIRKEGEPITSIEQIPKEDDKTIIEEAPVEEKKLDFNSFLEAAAVDKTPLEDKTKKEEPPKTKLETGLEELPVTEEVLKKVVPKTLKEFTTKPKTELEPRVVDDLPEELKVHFKDEMSRPAFEKIKPLILEHKTLKEQNAELAKKLDTYAKGGLPESYYEHPNAFILTPDYLNGLQTVQTAQSIVNHWEQQYQKVKEGAAEYEQLMMDKDGNLVTNKVKADSTAETTIMRALNFTQNQLIQQQAKLEGMSGIHKERHQQVVKWIDDHSNAAYNYFNSEEGKKLMPNVLGLLKQYHPSIQSNPLALSLAKSDIIIGMLATMIQNIQKEKSGEPKIEPKVEPKKETIITNRCRAAGPINSDIGGHDGEEHKNGEKTVTVDDFNRVKEGY